MLNSWKQATVILALVLASQCLSQQAENGQAISSAEDYSRAELLVRNRQWDVGLQILTRVLTTEPRNLKALNLAGIACAAKGDTQAADRYFERSLAVDPHFLPALRNLSINEFNARDYASAEKHLMVAEQLLPNDPTINLYLGQIAYRQQNYTLAAERLDRARSLLSHYPLAEAQLTVSFLQAGQKPRGLELLGLFTPSDLDPQLQLELGIALAEAGNNAQAISYLQAAFEHNPDSYNIGFDLALSYVGAMDYANAIKTIQDTIHRGHDTSEMENLFAEALAEHGEQEKAIGAYRKAIALDPSDENNYVDFASLCIDNRAFADGMKVIALGLHLHPNSERLTFMRGIVEASEDEVDLAEKDFQHATQLAPQRDLGAIGLGAVYLQHGHSGEAIRVIRKQLSQKPDDPNLLDLLGEALIASGAQPGEPVYGEAESVLEQSVKLNPGLSLPHVSLGSIYLREGRFADAAVQFEAALAIDPNENSAYSHLAVAYRHLGKVEKAKAVLAALQKLIEQQRSGERVKGITSQTKTSG